MSTQFPASEKASRRSEEEPPRLATPIRHNLSREDSEVPDIRANRSTSPTHGPGAVTVLDAAPGPVAHWTRTSLRPQLCRPRAHMVDDLSNCFGANPGNLEQALEVRRRHYSALPGSTSTPTPLPQRVNYATLPLLKSSSSRTHPKGHVQVIRNLTHVHIF